MKLHKMKTTTGVLEAVVTTSLSVAEDVLKLRLSKLARLPFAAKNRRVTLLEAEAASPGREVAYIVRARTAFDKP
jgi:hypothetical protein